MQMRQAMGYHSEEADGPGNLTLVTFVRLLSDTAPYRAAAIDPACCSDCRAKRDRCTRQLRFPIHQHA